ncbi:hypothetical protein [Skermania piniformis]|uniref:Gp28/Gp37-like domain-containing protein n=1 Tax=Skermania pinensis TaxID=39122 RepID=A0ABX8SGM9_9ACTN|nr:hypothetical protein [Skermania piniformis]QXQ14836.1 hypothetical protein KV203_05495 [Skermania piniformis]
MTAPPVDFLTLDDVRDHIVARRRREQRDALARPKMTICDKTWEPVCYLRGELAWDFEEVANDTGEGEFTIPGDHLLTEWLLRPSLRQADVHIVVDTPYWRWGGKCDQIQRIYKAGEMVAVRVHFLHDYHQAKKITCYANPIFPAEFQVPKAMPYAGPTCTGTILYGLSNAWRIQSLNAIPDNIFNPAQWSGLWDPAQWWTTFVPVNPLTDTSQWTVLSSRFANFHDLMAPTLASAGVLLQPQRWMPGEPQPAGNFYQLQHSTRVFRAIDKSGYAGPTGTMIDGLLNLVGTIAEDLINEIVTELATEQPDEYKLPGWFGTVKTAPWVVFPQGKHSTVRSQTMTIHKALAYAMVHGGKSPQWVNSAAKLAANAALGYLGMLVGNPGLALGVFDFLVEDTILAFHRVGNPFRKQAMGPDAYFENWVQGPGVGFTLSTLQAFITGFWDTRGYTSYTAEIDAYAPYVPGKHFGLMDRIGFDFGGEWYVDNVHAIRYKGDRATLPAWEISIGNDQAEEEPMAKLMRYKENILSLIQLQGVGV